MATVNQSMNATCSSGRWASISPVLPAGLSYSNGRISGTPTEPSPLIAYTIYTQNDNGVFYLGGSKL